MKSLVLIISMFMPVLGTAEDNKLTALVNGVAPECERLGIIANGIQMIRGDVHSSLDEILINTAAYISEEARDINATEQEFIVPDKNPIYLMQVRAVGKWVYFYYDDNFSPQLVGDTYAMECQIKTMADRK